MRPVTRTSSSLAPRSTRPAGDLQVLPLERAHHFLDRHAQRLHLSRDR
jgi:hypothetical protein